MPTRKPQEKGTDAKALRKPAAVALITGGRPDRDVVTDEDYRLAVEAQDATLFAQGNERKVLGKIRQRLMMGARDAGAKYYFDAERGIVRRREKEGAGS